MGLRDGIMLRQGGEAAWRARTDPRYLDEDGGDCTAAEPAGTGEGQEDIVVSEEGNALVTALREARAAVKAARQHAQGSAAEPIKLPPISPSQPSSGPGGVAGLPTSPFSAGCRSGVWERVPQQEMTALPPQFQQLGAGDRLPRGRSLGREEAQRRRAEAKAKAARDQERAAEATEAQRRRCARRAASERSARCEARQREEEERLIASLRHEADRSAAQRYSSSASRRAEQLRSHKQALARDLLQDLAASQLERRDAGEQKGRELQRRCEEADWGHCKAVVRSRLPPPAPGARMDVGGGGAATPLGSRDASERGSILRLPRLVAAA
mmetsp:Transcript_19124/g.39838  ORF Transcript_19124/g.39838 Transcript_19124/m.39838 type:complete len:326 (+) Transcript_19124:2-979(+)